MQWCAGGAEAIGDVQVRGFWTTHNPHICPRKSVRGPRIMRRVFDYRMISKRPLGPKRLVQCLRSSACASLRAGQRMTPSTGDRPGSGLKGRPGPVFGHAEALRRRSLPTGPRPDEQWKGNGPSVNITDISLSDISFLLAPINYVNPHENALMGFRLWGSILYLSRSCIILIWQIRTSI